MSYPTMSYPIMLYLSMSNTFWSKSNSSFGLFLWWKLLGWLFLKGRRIQGTASKSYKETCILLGLKHRIDETEIKLIISFVTCRLTETCLASITISGKDVFLRITLLISFTLDATFVNNSVTKNKRDTRGKQNFLSAFLSSVETGSSSENYERMLLAFEEERFNYTFSSSNYKSVTFPNYSKSTYLMIHGLTLTFKITMAASKKMKIFSFTQYRKQPDLSMSSFNIPSLLDRLTLHEIGHIIFHCRSTLP